MIAARFALHLSLFLATARLGVGAEHVVAPDGNDAHPGTDAQPWRTLAKASSSVQPGDTVRIRSGDYVEKAGWSVTRAGTADKPITYRAYGDGEVRITPSWVIPSGAWTRVKGAIYSTRVEQ